jgi:hypothetical protein
MKYRCVASFAAVLLFAGSTAHAITTTRVANVFDTSEEIVATIAQSSGTVPYVIDYGTYFNEVITGSVTVVNNTVRIPAHFLTCGVATITVNGESMAAAIVPGVIRYSDHLVSPVWQHMNAGSLSNNPAGHAYLFLQLGFGGTNQGDQRYTVPPSATFLNFQRAMVAEGLYCQGKEGWQSTCNWNDPAFAAQVRNWTQTLINSSVTRMAMTLGNEPEAAGFWTCTPTDTTYTGYQKVAYTNIKAAMPDAIVGGPDAVMNDSHASFWNTFFDPVNGARDHCDYFSFHQTAMGVDRTWGVGEGDVHTWVRRLKSYGVSKPMVDGEVMCGTTGGLEHAGAPTYWHMNGWLGAWPTIESAIIGAYVRGVVRTDIFNPDYEGRPLWNNLVNPIRNLTSKALAARTLSDWLSGSYPLGRIDTGVYHASFTWIPGVEVWATRRGNVVGLWLWTNERVPEQNPIMQRVEIITAAQAVDVVDDQGNVNRVPILNRTLRFRINPVPTFIYGFPDIPQVVPADFPNQPPVITSTHVTEAVVGGLYLYKMQCYDPETYLYRWNKQLPTYTLLQAPAGMSIGSFGGRIQWVPAPDQVGQHRVVVQVHDREGAAAHAIFTVTVKPAGENVAPQFVSNPPRVAPVNKEYFYAPRVFDPNGDPITYTLVSGPAGAAIDSSGIVRWTPATSMGTVFTVRASDGRGGTADQTFDVASGIVAIRTAGGWPPAPSALSAVANPDGTVALSWTDNSSGDRQEKAFVIERSSVAPPAHANLAFGTSAYYDMRPFIMVHAADADVTMWTDAPRASGTYWYRVKAVNHIADWGGYSDIVSVVAHGSSNAPPSVAITAPADGTQYGMPVNVELAAHAVDPDGVVTAVQFYVGTTMLHTDTQAPFMYVWVDAPAGTHVLSARATDNEGATAVSSPVTLVIADGSAVPPPPDDLAVGEVRLLGGERGYAHLGKGDRVRIAFRPGGNGEVSVQVFTLRGARVWGTTAAAVAGVTRTVEWDTPPAAGVYLVHVKGPGIGARRRIVVVR